MKKYPAALAASAVFVAAIRLFRAPYLAWERLWLVTGLSLLAAVSFDVIVWLTLAQRRTLSKKTFRGGASLRLSRIGRRTMERDSRCQ